MIIGLPDVTVWAIGIAMVIITVLLVLWGIFFPKVDE